MKELLSFMQSLGLHYVPQFSGSFESFPIDGGETRGWFIGSRFIKGGVEYINATFGDHANPKDPHPHFTSSTEGLTPDEIAEIEAESKAQVEAYKAAREERAKDAASKAKLYYSMAKDEGESPYLKRKGVRRYHPARIINETTLMIPAYNTMGELTTLQYIQEDGSKTFLTGGRKNGSFFRIGGDNEHFYLCEGYATGASIYEALDYATVIVCFDLGNILPVLEALGSKYPTATFILCADNDQKLDSKTNPGVDQCLKIHAKYPNVRVVVPHWADGRCEKLDFNDLHAIEGIEAVKRGLVPPAYEETKEHGPIGEEPSSTCADEPEDDEMLYWGKPLSYWEDCGFTKRSKDPKKKDLICYPALLAKFEQVHNHRTQDETGIVYSWSRGVYSHFFDTRVREFPVLWMKEHPASAVSDEFCRQIKRTNLTPVSFFSAETTQGKLNLENGVVDIKSGNIEPHNTYYGFLYRLPYAWCGDMATPNYTKFIGEVCEGNKQKIALLEEILGYCISGASCWLQFAFILEGEGSNGKSKLLELLQGVAGPKNYSSVSFKHLEDPVHILNLEGKLFNACDEIPTKTITDSTIFKSLITGGTVSGRKLYFGSYEFRNQAKMIYTCNQLPSSIDATQGYLRRLIVIPFNATFTDKKGNRDPYVLEKMLPERAGILARWLGAYNRLVERGKLDFDPSTLEKMAEYAEEVDTLGTWARENLRTTGDRNDVLLLSDIFERYKIQMEADKNYVQNAQIFGKRIAQIFPDYKAQKCWKTVGPHSQKAVWGFVWVHYTDTQSNV